MTQKRVAIACQGGGSQCAFVAGALSTLLARGVHEDFRIIGLSGTSGGAFTAALAWMGMLKRAQGDRTPIEDRILACWKDLTAQTPLEIGLDHFYTQLLRLVSRGVLPNLATSPASLQFKLWAQLTSALIGRPEFTDLAALLRKHLDFDALPSLVKPDSPVLLVGAIDVTEGTFKVFSSMYGEIRLESLLASAAIPNLFPAVEVDGHAYWDGIFSSNPPVIAFLQKAVMGKVPLPEEIWIIQVNPTRYASAPDSPNEIFDRRNHLAGNLSLQHELETIQMINALLQGGALTRQYLSRFGMEVIQPITVRFIRMSEQLLRSLDYPSKLSREPRHIERLLADGAAQANAFLDSVRRTKEQQPLGFVAPLDVH
ncbi:MAG: patatin-like phospholipase family protein [Pseudomonadota bacterium]